ncbi:hypothetical protein [Rhizobium esperanzae]|nr:hypothetical protein [Rhizobium esperanzae]
MTVIEFLTFLFSIPPERLAGVTALGAIALAMMTLWVIHSLVKGRDK